jgi:hypothetical protein
MGSTTERACDLSLKIKDYYGKSVSLSPKTETIMLIDDFEPLDSEHEPLCQIRYNSAIHITIEMI